MSFHHRNRATSFVKAIGEPVARPGWRPIVIVRIGNPLVIIGHSPEKSTNSCIVLPERVGGRGPETKTAVDVFDIFVDFRSRPVSVCKCLFLIDFYALSPGDRDVSCRRFHATEDGVKTEFMEILSYFSVLQISGTTGTGDALSFNRKHMLTERGHDQPTVK
jgi:hypothetical protein